ncbi:hypothetical protein K9L16_03625 [Candidatus Pacearchaeota archaeon]|nr:hypothetical protein [Candidatus Pacearchaeota archaeon]
MKIEKIIERGDEVLINKNITSISDGAGKQVQFKKDVSGEVISVSYKTKKVLVDVFEWPRILMYNLGDVKKINY